MDNMGKYLILLSTVRYIKTYIEQNGCNFDLDFIYDFIKYNLKIIEERNVK